MSIITYIFKYLFIIPRRLMLDNFRLKWKLKLLTDENLLLKAKNEELKTKLLLANYRADLATALFRDEQEKLKEWFKNYKKLISIKSK